MEKTIELVNERIRDGNAVVVTAERMPGVVAELDWGAIPVHPEAVALARKGMFPGGALSNLEAYAEHVHFAPALGDWQQLLLADPQTSGGLLVAFAPSRLEGALAAFREAGVPTAVIGRLVAGPAPRIVVSGR